MSIISVFPGGGKPKLQTKTVTPTESAQTVSPSSGYDGLLKVTVNSIPSSYVKPSVTKSAATYTPGTSDQSIAAGTYCSGKQTIKGDANLAAENIKSGVSIFGITGALELGYDIEIISVPAEGLIFDDGSYGTIIEPSTSNSELVAKNPGKVPTYLYIIQQEADFDAGDGGIVFVNGVRITDTSGVASVVIGQNDVDAAYYYAQPDWLHIEANAYSVKIIADESSTEQRQFIGTYSVALLYDKTA